MEPPRRFRDVGQRTSPNEAVTVPHFLEIAASFVALLWGLGSYDQVWGEACANRKFRASRRDVAGQACAERNSMAFHDMAGATCRALTARKDGPSLYDVCDPLLLNGAGGDRHLA